MQQGRVERDQLLTLEAVDDITRRGRVVDRFELRGDGVQPPHGAAVVVLVVALDELQGEPVQEPGTAVDRCKLIAHDTPFAIAKRSSAWHAERARYRVTPRQPGRAREARPRNPVPYIALI